MVRDNAVLNYLTGVLSTEESYVVYNSQWFVRFLADVSSIDLTEMSLRVPGGVYLMPPSGAPLSQGSGPPHNQNKPPAAVAIVTPQRSNSLDFLNFEEKRQLIASSLSLTDFLHHSGSATSPSSPTSGNVFIGELLWKRTFLSLLSIFQILSFVLWIW